MATTECKRKYSSSSRQGCCDKKNNQDGSLQLEYDAVARHSITTNKQPKTGSYHNTFVENQDDGDDIHDSSISSKLESFPPEVLQHILLFLDNPRDVWNITMQTFNKQLSSSSSSSPACLTDEAVLRSAIFHKSRTRKFLADIMELVSNQAIHVPSTRRLLRLVNATECERGSNCFGYNVATKRSGKIQNSHHDHFDSRKDCYVLGLCICDSCQKHLIMDLSFIPPFAHGHDQVAIWKNRYMLRDSHLETITGDAAGPLILAHDILQIDQSCYTNHEKHQALGQLLRQRKCAGAATPSHNDESCGRRTRLLHLYHQVRTEYKNIEMAKRLSKNTGEADKKMDQLLGIYKQLSHILQDYPFWEELLKCRWEHSVSERKWNVSCTFLHPLSQKVLGNLMTEKALNNDDNDPSSSIRTNSTSAARMLREIHGRMHLYGFLGEGHGPTGFLHFLAASDKDQDNAGTALRRYCILSFTWQTLLSKIGPHLSQPVASCSDFCHKLCHCNKPADALCSLLTWQQLGNAFSMHLATQLSSRRFRKYQKLAHRLWLRNRPAFSGSCHSTDTIHHIPPTFAEYQRHFETCCQQFGTLYHNFHDYIASGPTALFLSEMDDPPAHSPHQSFTRLRAVLTALTRGSLEELLWNRDFDTLLQIHIQMFQNPGAFGYEPITSNIHPRNYEYNDGIKSL